MIVLSLSLDPNFKQNNSNVVKRWLDYAKLVDKFIVIGLGKNREQKEINSNLIIYSSGGKNKIQQLWQVLKLLLKLDYDIISSQDYYYLGFLSLIIAKLRHKKIELQIHGFEKTNFWRLLLFKILIKKVDIIRVVSQRLKKYLQDKYKISINKIVVIPIYVDMDFFKKRINLIKKKQKFIFLSVNRLESVKQIDWQIKAVKELVKKKLNNFELWIIGRGSLSEKMRQMVRKNNLDNLIKFIGYVDKNKLREFYQQADCFLLTSKSEGYARVLIEAGASNLPIISTNVGLVGYEFKNNLIVNSYFDLADYMFKIMTDYKLKKTNLKQIQLFLNKVLTKAEILKLYQQTWLNLLEK